MVAVTGEVPEFEATKGLISPVPERPRPIDGLSFIQE